MFRRRVSLFLITKFYPKLDYSFELMLKSKEPVSKARFREHIYASEPECIRDEEVDFLFDLLDYSKNEVIDKDDFPNKG